MKKLVLIFVLSTILASCVKQPKNNTDALEKPNIIFIYLDDLGYGDVSAYGAT